VSQVLDGLYNVYMYVQEAIAMRTVSTVTADTKVHDCVLCSVTFIGTLLFRKLRFDTLFLFMQ